MTSTATRCWMLAAGLGVIAAGCHSTSEHQPSAAHVHHPGCPHYVGPHGTGLPYDEPVAEPSLRPIPQSAPVNQPRALPNGSGSILIPPPPPAPAAEGASATLHPAESRHLVQPLGGAAAFLSDEDNVTHDRSGEEAGPVNVNGPIPNSGFSAPGIPLEDGPELPQAESPHADIIGPVALGMPEFDTDAVEDDLPALLAQGDTSDDSSLTAFDRLPEVVPHVPLYRHAAPPLQLWPLQTPPAIAK